MSSVFKGKSTKSKADSRQKSGIVPPSIRVEETPPDLLRDYSYRDKAKDMLHNLFFIEPSHSHTTFRAPSERRKNQENLLALDATANINIGDTNRSVEMENNLDESLKLTYRRMGSGATRASEEIIVDTENQSPNLPMVSKRQVQVMRTIDGGAFHQKPQQLDKGKGPNRLGGAGRLAPMPGHLRQDDDNCEIPRNQLPDNGGPSGQEITHVSSQYFASQLQGAHHFTIGGNPHFENNRVKKEYHYGNHVGTYDITILKEFVSFRALYNSSAQDPTRRVHPGTRQRVLKRIMDWIDTPSAKERIFWLHGPAGVGKSAIAQTIARSCSRGKLAATFFFYRSDPSRNDGNRLFTTLAWQLAHSIPATKNALIHSLNECPDIPMTDVETQFEELIVKPFLALKMSGIQLSPPVVIIDGVDECSDGSLQRRFLKTIGNAVKDDRVPLRFLICSRPEAHIQDMIDTFPTLTLALDLAKLNDANQDIEKYLRAEFSRIATEQGLDPAWPGEQRINEFVYKACGQFIYALTIIKCVDDEYSSAETQLDIIRGLKPASNILDELYKEILRRQRDPVFLKDFLSLFIGRNGTKLNNPLVDYLHEDDALLLNVSEMELHRKLRGMHSVLRFKPYIDVHHQSFLDFLQDSSRSGQYYISKQVGMRRYLDLIVGSLVRYASTDIERHDDQKIHFNPQFYKLAHWYPAKIVLPVEQWRQALQPLVDLQNELLTLPNFRCSWEFLPCKECTCFHIIRDLLLHRAFLLGTSSDLVLHSGLMAESHALGSEVHNSGMPSIPTEMDANALEKDLNACLSSLLPRLRSRKLGILLGTDMIQLVCSLLRFDHTQIAMKLQSISDAQNVVNVIDELINNEYLCRDYIPDISCKAFRLALKIYTRVPVIPWSLFSKGTIGSHHDVWLTSRNVIPETELLFQTAFMSKTLDPSYIVRVSWVYEEYNLLLSVVDRVNKDMVSLTQWRQRSKPSSATRIRVMLEVAKALRYLHSMGILLHDRVDSDDIFLDSEFHARFRFLGLTAHYVNETSDWSRIQERYSHEANIFMFGCLFYEMCFDVEITYRDRRYSNSNAVAEHPSKPDIQDDQWQLIQRCCAKEPKSRPTMDDVVREMEAWNIN